VLGWLFKRFRKREEEWLTEADCIRMLQRALGNSYTVWYVATALRGPDIVDDAGRYIKDAFTCNIRAAVSAFYRGKDWPARAVGMTEIIGLLTSDLTRHYHVLDHLDDAARALGENHYDVELRKFYVWLARLIRVFRDLEKLDIMAMKRRAAYVVDLYDMLIDKLMELVEAGVKEGWVEWPEEEGEEEK